uniref:Uncharacterized protein n=1 Tax=Romanomermis culicivorax TaxID=13658 RepID=A0A915I8C5_ROMCU
MLVPLEKTPGKQGIPMPMSTRSRAGSAKRRRNEQLQKCLVMQLTLAYVQISQSSNIYNNGSNGVNNEHCLPAFELTSPNDVQFTVGSFAMTRFGTTKVKNMPTALRIDFYLQSFLGGLAQKVGLPLKLAALIDRSTQQ